MIPHCMSNDEASPALLDFHSYLQRCPSRLPAGNNPPLIHYLTGIQTQHAPYPLVLSAKTTKEHPGRFLSVVLRGRKSHAHSRNYLQQPGATEVNLF